MIVMVIGITMINNYDRMKNMEKTLNTISRVVNNEDEKIATDWFAKNEETDKENSENKETANSSQDVNVNQSTNETQEVMNQSAIPVETVSGNVEKQEETDTDDAEQETSEQTTTEQTTTEQATPDTSSTQQATGTVTEISSTEEEMKKTLQESNGDTSASNEKKTEEASAEPKYYTVEKGDTLAKISLKLYNTKDMVAKICELNNIKNDNKIQAGQTLLLP